MTQSNYYSQLQKRFLKRTTDSVDDVKLLEYLLYVGDPQCDAAGLAQKLMERFGSFNNVLEMPPVDLLSVEGVPEDGAVLIAMILDANRRYMLNRTKADLIMMNLEDCGECMMPYFQGLRYECVYMMSLDAKAKVICVRQLGRGDLGSATISVRNIVTAALETNAQSVVLAHNHPAGIALPSEEDIRSTLMIRDALRAVGVILLDHIVVADSDYVSLRQSGYFQE